MSDEREPLWTLMLHDRSTDRFHPMPFRAVPRPSDEPGDTTCRHRSIGHHTFGFADRAEADKFCAERGWVVFDTLTWDGRSSPHTVMDLPRTVEDAALSGGTD